MVLSHKKLASWYLQLAQAQEAGLTLAESLRTSGGPPVKDLNNMAARIEAGHSVDDLMRSPPRWLPKADRYFVSAAASTGRLPQTFHNLAQSHAAICANVQKMVLALLYPIGVFNCACFLLPFNQAVNFEQGFSFDWSIYLNAILPPLGILWGGMLLIFMLIKAESPIISMLMQWMPGLRGYYHSKMIANFASSLGTFLNAGIPIDQSWAGAGLITNDKRMMKVVSRMKKIIDHGGSPGQHLAQYAIFPHDFRALYATGERTGKLDSNLIQIGNEYHKKSNQKMMIILFAYPSILFLIIAGFMAYAIMMMYADYFATIKSITD